MGTDHVTCPKCGSAELQRIHRSKFVKTFFFFLRRYRCYSCNNKVYLMAGKLDGRSVSH